MEKMTEQQQVRLGRRVTWIGFWANIGLAVLKVLAGIFGRSSAMIADGIHSASDLLTDVAVIVVIGVSRKKADSDHAYGHGKIETFVTFAIAVVLAGVGLGIGYDGVERALESLRDAAIPQPGWIALAMAVASILVKEWLFRYSRRVARRIGSTAMEANAWHHRSDAYSSIATLAGVAGAMFLGARWRILDPLAAVFVSVLILIMAWSMAKQAVLELLETSLPADETDRISAIIGQTPGVESFHRLRTRRNGNTRIVDCHIHLAPDITLRKAHDIATDVEKRIAAEFSPVTVNVHMEPSAR